MKFSQFLFQYLLPGLALILLGFVAGAQKDPTFGMFAFLCFFVAGVTLMIEGFKKYRRK